MTRRTRLLCALLSPVLAVTGLAIGVAAQAGASQISDPGPANTLPNAVPAASTPSVDDGQVNSIAQVGSTMVMGGTFTSVNGQARSGIAAFDKSSFALSSFAPTLNGTVNVVIPGPSAGTVYAGGTFTQVNGTAAQFITLLDLSTGAPVPGFTAPKFNYGYINDLVLRTGRLYVAGTFTVVGGKTHGGLVSLNPATGAVDPFISVQLTGHHNDTGSGAQGWIGPWDIDVSADGKTLVAIGNFKYADGQLHDQVVLLDLSGSTETVAPWNTNRYAPYCFSFAFDAYVRGVSFSPDGSYFVVNATGGGNPGTLCDSTARFETDLSNTSAQPTWVDETGGDTVWGITVTNTAIYIGGHNRWNNNPLGVDHAQAGAVPRPGLAALDPVSGRPFAWNPGHNPLGTAVYAILGTTDGVWIGWNAKYIGNYKYLRPRIALFKYTGGYQPASTATPSLPATAYLGSASGLKSVAFDGTHASATSASAQGIDFGNWRGAFLVGNHVFYAYTDGYFYSRTFTGSTFGPAVKIDPYHDPVWDGVDTNDGTTFDGAFPSLYGQISSITGMAYNQGRLYYTLAGDPKLYSRWFNPDAGIIDETTVATTASVNLANADGMFITGGNLYYVDATSGNLYRVPFAGGTTTGASTLVSGPSVDGVSWANRALFLYRGSQPPTAAFTSQCSALTCSFDGSGSSDPDGSIAAYAWDFGDGATASSAEPTHTYQSGGTYTVSLKVTDNHGASDTITHSITVTAPPSGVAFVGADHSAGGAVKAISATLPKAASAGNVALLFLSRQSSSTWSGPAGVTGWTQVGTVANSTLTTTVWQKTVAASDPATKVTFTCSAYDHAALSVDVYSGVSTSTPVAGYAQSIDTNKSAHVSPTTTSAGSWMVTYYADRSTATRTYALPAQLTTRDTAPDTGSLTLQQVVADSNGVVSAGSYGGLTASTDATTNRSIAWTIALNAAR